MLRPRGLSHVLYQKYLTDEKLEQFNKDQWYRCDTRRLHSSIGDKFYPLSLDADTKQFLNQCIDKSSNVILQLWHLFVKFLLGFFVTKTSLNGLLRRGSMFVFSLDQFISFTCYNGVRQGTLLDLGAGDGEVTNKLSQLFQDIYVTEISKPMRRILKNRGFRLLNVEDWFTLDNKYDVITCLNLLDRCDRPIDLLTDIRKVMKPSSLLVVAIVVPFTQYVEAGNGCTVPTQSLDIIGENFEEQCECIIQELLIPCGYDVVRWSRVPYLCEGDLNQSYYSLDDALFLLKLADVDGNS